MLTETDAVEMQQAAQRIVREVEKVIIGKRNTIELAIVSLLADGHVLIEDIPGVGKTTLAKSLALALGCSFKRIQFTPDLLPADVTGVTVYNQKSGDFVFMEGPIFANIVLADEINRASPKTQASLLECMGEGQVTVDGVTHRVPRPFFVIATENPIEYRGTYPLPESQLDRFLMRIRLGYPDHDQEIAILDSQATSNPIDDVGEVIDGAGLMALQKGVRNVHVADNVKGYIVGIVESTRNHPDIALGGSPRGSLGLMRTSQAAAVLSGREFVTPDDVKRVTQAVLSHRVVIRPELPLKGGTAEKVIGEVLASISVPTGV